VNTPEIVAVALVATSAAVALVTAAVWWYRGLPHVQQRKRLKDRERMVQGFRKHLPHLPGGPVAKPPKDKDKQ
jgi:hypothetical protein